MWNDWIGMVKANIEIRKDSMKKITAKGKGEEVREMDGEEERDIHEADKK